MCRMYKCSNSCLWCSCWWNLDFSFKSYGKESLYKYCMNVDDGRIIRSWRSCLLFLLLFLCVFCLCLVLNVGCFSLLYILDCPFGFLYFLVYFPPLHCLSLYDLRLLNTLLVSLSFWGFNLSKLFSSVIF
jgi:hypothetical protein